jgi:hypothetical protein
MPGKWMNTVKGKVHLEQATKTQKWSRGIALLFNLSARWWWWVVNARHLLLS